MGRCAQCASGRIQVAPGVRLGPATFAALGFAVLVALLTLAYVQLRHRPGEWGVRGPSVGLEALIFYWAMAAIEHARHERTSPLRLWAQVVAKSAIAAGLLWAWCAVVLHLRG